MFNSTVVVKVSPFQKEGKLADKNGLPNVYLTAIAGQIPSTAQVVSGTVAERAGLKIGGTFLVMVSEGKEDAQYGRQFNHTVIGEVAAMEVVTLQKELGRPSVLDTKASVTNPDDDILVGKGASPALNSSSWPIGSAAADQDELAELQNAAAKTAPKAGK